MLEGESMSRYIDADALGIGKANRDVFENKAYADGWNAAIDIIESAPTADVAEVVRLKDGLDDCHIVSDGEYCGYDCGDVARLIEKLQNKIAVQAHFADIGKMVEMPPTANVTEVVRCKDCKFFCRGNRCYCEEFGGIVTEDDFCSRGERNDENEQTHGC